MIGIQPEIFGFKCLEIPANVASSKLATLGLGGVAFALFATVLEPLLITINVSTSDAVAT